MRVLLMTFLLAAVLSANCQESKFYGSEFDTADPVTLETLVEQLHVDGDASDIVVTGTVEEVCKVKGCWMTMQTEDGQSVRVTFRDYGFFVPMDIHGRTVVIKGSGKVSVTSVGDLRHYAEDEGKSKEEIEAITEPLEEYVFVADGVYIE